MLQEWLSALTGFLLALAAWWVPVVYVVAAGVITHSIAGDNERVRNWMVGLFLTIGALLLLLAYVWWGGAYAS